jgi:hypothetical protein
LVFFQQQLLALQNKRKQLWTYWKCSNPRSNSFGFRYRVYYIHK